MPTGKLPTFNEIHLRGFLSAILDPTAGATELRIIRGQWRSGFLESSDYSTTFSGWYDNLNDLVVDIKKLRELSGYITINPVDRNLLARSYNRLQKSRRDASTSDADIVCWRRFLIDIDPVRKADISSTNDELAKAIERRDQILSDLPEIAATSIWGRSGNGCWIAPRLPDYPNDSEHREMVARMLAYLAGRYTDEVVKIDPATKNAARIMCIPGTLKCKGSNLPERPWRFSTLDSPTEQDQGKTFDLTEFLQTHAPLPPPASPTSPGGPPGGGNGDKTSSNGHATNSGSGSAFRPVDIAYATAALVRETSLVAGAPEGTRNVQLNKSAFALGQLVSLDLLSQPFVEQELTRAAERSGLSNGDIHATLSSGLRKGMLEPRDLSKVGLRDARWHGRPIGEDGGPVRIEPVDVEDIRNRAQAFVDGGKVEELYRATDFHILLARLEVLNTAEAEAIKVTLRQIPDFAVRPFDRVMAEPRAPYRHLVRTKGSDLTPFECTDLGNGKRLVRLFGHRIRHCKSYGDWLIYDGQRWAVDQLYTIEAMAQQVPAQILTEIPPSPAEEVVQTFRDWYLISQSKEKMFALVVQARSMVAVTPHDLDRNHWLLNVRNGTIDLRTDEFRSHCPIDLITKIANVEYDPSSKCPTWERFISEILNGDGNLIAYLRRAIGYSITGTIREHVFFFLYGTGRNGKTTMLNVLYKLLGDYANEIDSELILSQNQTQHPTALTELEGRRLISIDEADENRRLAEGQVKKITGNNPIQARRMHENNYTFLPTHHVFFAANHKPEIRGMDPAIWRRVKLIPFEVSFDLAMPGGREPDLDLESKLLAEGPGILNWMLRGCREWQDHGLDEPRAVRDVVSNYRHEMDTLGWYVEERCKTDPTRSDMRSILSALYADYVAWCRVANIDPLSVRRFSGQLTDKGCKTHKTGSMVYKLGIRLKTDVERAIEKEAAEKQAAQDANEAPDREHIETRDHEKPTADAGGFDWTNGNYSDPEHPT